MNLPGGISNERQLFSEIVKKVFDIALEHRRTMMVLDSGAVRGTRFHDNNSVLMRIESMFSEEEFMAYPGPCLDKALLDAAQADYWYSYEKEYDSYFNDETDYDSECDE